MATAVCELLRVGGDFCANLYQSQFVWADDVTIMPYSLCTGVYLSLGSGNNSNILISNIGEGDSDALLCYTDLTQCCRDVDGMALGEWFYPNGSEVDVSLSGSDFYRNRGPSLVRLNRRNNATSPKGQFCCVVPDATSTNVTVCANLCKLLKGHLRSCFRIVVY